MEANTRNRTIALAALFQCVEGVSQIATRGVVDKEILASCINSLLADDVKLVEELYGGLNALKTGLGILLVQLGSGQSTPDGKSKDMEATRYGISLLYLERKLNNDPDMFRALLRGIEVAQAQQDFFDADHPNMIARLAELYSQTISKIGPRIIIKGEQKYLADPDNAAKIRVLLLGGIRASLLWRQAGGNRWKLLLSRGAMQDEAHKLLRGL